MVVAMAPAIGAATRTPANLTGRMLPESIRYRMTRQSPPGSSPRLSAARHRRVSIGNSRRWSGTSSMTCRLGRVSATSWMARPTPRSRCLDRNRRTTAWTSSRLVSASTMAAKSLVAALPSPLRRSPAIGMGTSSASRSKDGAAQRTCRAGQGGPCPARAFRQGGYPCSARTRRRPPCGRGPRCRRAEQDRARCGSPACVTHASAGPPPVYLGRMPCGRRAVPRRLDEAEPSNVVRRAGWRFRVSA